MCKPVKCFHSTDEQAASLSLNPALRDRDGGPAHGDLVGDVRGHCYSTDTKITTSGLLEKQCTLCLRATEFCWRDGMESEGWIPGAALWEGGEGRDPCLCHVHPRDFVVDLAALGVFLTLQI